MLQRGCCNSLYPTCLPICGDTIAYTPAFFAAAVTTAGSPPVVPMTKETPLSA